ncbi:unnamed protein product [Amoebophrya sp. A120]|nr:unnamed protein product [Amoebophrya sp. A120]|eukprot:GSA120T00008835001.1
MYGRSLYGGYGGYGGGYGMGMGGYGAMGMYGMGGMYGAGGQQDGNLQNSVNQMFQMTQMMELNTMFLDQMQEQFSQISYRISQLMSWLFGLKGYYTNENESLKKELDTIYEQTAKEKQLALELQAGDVDIEAGGGRGGRQGTPATSPYKNTSRLKHFESLEQRQLLLSQIKKRIRMLLAFFLLFLIYTYRKYRNGKRLAKQAQRIWSFASVTGAAATSVGTMLGGRTTEAATGHAQLET